MYTKEILKTIQTGNITKSEGAKLLKQFKNFDVSIYARDDSEAKEFFELCKKAGLNFPQIEWV